MAEPLDPALVAKKYIDKRVESTITQENLAKFIEDTVNARVVREIDAMVRRRINRLKRDADAAESEAKIPVSKILDTVQRVTGVFVDDIRGPCRARRTSYPRFLACYLIRNLRRDLSLPAIGEVFNRHHTTIINACRKWEEVAQDDPKCRVWLEHKAVKQLLEPINECSKVNGPEPGEDVRS